jgi:aspartyl-tRNA synthetase
VPTKPFPKITLAEAKEKLKAAGVTGEKEFDFSTEEEKELGEIIKRETGHDFVFVTDYPIEARPFYHMRHADQPNLTKSFDLLYRGLEITTGSQREHRVEVLEKQAIEKGMSLEELKDYLNFFRYGCPSHGGAGIGPARIIMKMLDLSSVKEACFLPRDVKRLTP